MATSKTFVSQSQFFATKTHLRKNPDRIDSSSITCVFHDLTKPPHGFHKLSFPLNLKPSHFALKSNSNSHVRIVNMPSICRSRVVSPDAIKDENHNNEKPMTFVEELRSVAMKLHVKEPAKEGGKKKTMAQILMGAEMPSLDGYVKFLVDSKLVYDTLENIISNPTSWPCAQLRNTGLERSGALANDLEWFSQEMGMQIPSPTAFGISYACYLEEISMKNPKAIPCHFYDIYFGHAVGGRILGKKVAEKILENKELEFYKYNGELSEMLQNVREKLNIVAEGWSREDKDQCLEQTEISFKYSEDIMKLIILS
ncbi:hypothetical protein C5167_036536 [Papaver somniferum]|uniref:heme oxygenase (biliverdin-producing) n=1 Tax=Papaver somniferum TaxID=3469 RepID=A0A4Y7I7I2_PAPSO|nr:heme oxygenase 1, chloroplastic-like [Papaver somniferum]RZC43591.1 hypothetical protein C5167_036536 [Papaver somniferum]